MTIEIIREKISQERLHKLAQGGFVDMIKGVVDLRQEIVALGGELHADAEAILLEQGSKQKDLWGFNIYLDKSKSERIEFSSLINIRPSYGSRAMAIKDEHLQRQIRAIVDRLIE